MLEQAEYTYDANGNVIMTTDRQRFHDDGTTTGALGTASSGTHARVSYSVSYYDAANRTTATVNVGTNGGSNYTRPGSVPSRSDTALVTSYDYNAAGEADVVTDPRGIQSKTWYDALGQTLFTVQDWDGSYDPTASGALPPAVGGTETHIDQTTGYTYDGDGNETSVTAVMPSGTHSQTTAYVYGVTKGTNAGISSNDILLKVEYPSKTTGAASTSSSDE